MSNKAKRHHKCTVMSETFPSSLVLTEVNENEGYRGKELLLALYTEWYLQALFRNSELCNASNANIWIVKKKVSKKTKKIDTGH